MEFCNAEKEGGEKEMLGSTKGKNLVKYVGDYVVFDLETTGIYTDSDEVIEISGIKVKDGKATEEFTSLVNPGRHIPKGASAVNGITDDMVKDAQDFSAVLRKFLEFAGDLVLVGHNIHTFDMKFIYRDAQKFYGDIPGNDYIDTLRFARQVLPGLSHYKLVDLAEHYGISAKGAHRALNDCRMNQQVFECLAKEVTPEKMRKGGQRICPRCGSFLAKRNGKFGEFWGCTSYPGCRYTENC